MIYEFPQKILFKHCDPAGIVFYPRYFEMLNDCVEAFFADIGFAFEDIHKVGRVPTVQIDATFSTPSLHGDRMVINLQITRIGRSSIGLDFHAHCGGSTRFTATSTLVYISPDNSAQALPDDMRTALAPYLRRTT
ncbi:MAG: thioesterase family protein [Planktotalea sp.]|uniref:acyl-CoA thioesterase n=1 Tax=Planktotalea sp. TaxID=2029877 RepID=UPI003C748C4B